VDEAGLIEDGQAVEELGGEDADEGGGEAAEGVLLDELVKVGGEELEDEAKVGVVNEGVLEAEDVVCIVGIPRIIELRPRK
jgi:hypothetical protein